eukprot:scaffold69823_cov60-Phaeocystis_antarctica.AAC.2
MCALRASSSAPNQWLASTSTRPVEALTLTDATPGTVRSERSSRAAPAAPAAAAAASTASVASIAFASAATAVAAALDLAPHLAAAHLVIEIVQRAVLRACELRGTRLLARLAQQRPEPRAAGGLAGELACKWAAPLRAAPLLAAAVLAEVRGQCHVVLAEAAAVRAFPLLAARLLAARLLAARLLAAAQLLAAKLARRRGAARGVGPHVLLVFRLHLSLAQLPQQLLHRGPAAYHPLLRCGVLRGLRQAFLGRGVAAAALAVGGGREQQLRKALLALAPARTAPLAALAALAVCLLRRPHRRAQARAQARGRVALARHLGQLAACELLHASLQLGHGGVLRQCTRPRGRALGGVERRRRRLARRALPLPLVTPQLRERLHEPLLAVGHPEWRVPHLAYVEYVLRQAVKLELADRHACCAARRAEAMQRAAHPHAREAAVLPQRGGARCRAAGARTAAAAAAAAAAATTAATSGPSRRSHHRRQRHRDALSRAVRTRRARDQPWWRWVEMGGEVGVRVGGQSQSAAEARRRGADVAEAHEVHPEQVVVDLELQQVRDVCLERLRRAPPREPAACEERGRLLDVRRLDQRDAHEWARLRVVAVEGRAVHHRHVEDSLSVVAQHGRATAECIVELLGERLELDAQRTRVGGRLAVKGHEEVAVDAVHVQACRLPARCRAEDTDHRHATQRLTGRPVASRAPRLSARGVAQRRTRPPRRPSRPAPWRSRPATRPSVARARANSSGGELTGQQATNSSQHKTYRRLRIFCAR